MKLVLFVISVTMLLASFKAQAQKEENIHKKTETKVDRTDPAAKNLLNQLRSKYGAYEALTIKYSLTIESGEDKEMQVGEMAQAGEQFRVDNQGNVWLSDACKVWLYNKQVNEVQVSCYDEEEMSEEMISPNQILKMHEREKDFFFAITHKDSKYYKIEFKPRSENTDYFKIRIVIDRVNMELKEVKIFEHGGTRYTLVIDKIEASEFPNSHFKFNPKQHPGVIENDFTDEECGC